MAKTEVRENPGAPYVPTTINSIHREGKSVIVEFDKACTHLQLTAEQACQIADKLRMEALVIS